MPAASKTKKLTIPPDTPEHPWVRNSERSTFARCPQAWDWAFVDRLKPKTPKPALRFGLLVHSAMEDYYLPGLKRGIHPVKSFLWLYDADEKRNGAMTWGDRESGSRINYRDLGEEMLTNYIDHYGKDSRWKVLAKEFPFHCPVYHPKTKRVMFTFVGVIDLVVLDRQTGFTGIVDHKTTGDDPTKKTDVLILDDQTSGYWSFGQEALRREGMIKKGTRLDGMLFNFLRKGKKDDRPQNELGQYLNQPKTKAERERGYGEVSKTQPPPLFHREPVYRSEYDNESFRYRAISQWRVMQMMREGDLPVYKTPGVLHAPHCRMCEFKEMCELQESGADWEEFRDRVMVTWDPYSQHEIMEGR
jgi:hypothetical protein